MPGADEFLTRISRLPPKRLALLASELRTRIEVLEGVKPEPIAIIGLGCRFPGAGDPDAFWRLLIEGVDAIREIPPDRWDVDRYYDPDVEAPGRMSTRWGGFLDEVDRFDPLFFGISPREAMHMDPQQRLLLEVGWEALERSGIAPCSLKGSRTGVFIGISSNEYALAQMESGEASGLHAHGLTGGTLNAAAGRLAYVLGLQGPCLAVDTACSSSLVAVHLACQSLRSRECDLALVGGVNLILSPLGMISASKARMMAADGRCKAFDARADGFVRSEGCGVVVLKRESDAKADHDSILARILGSAVNQDGATGGFTVPNGTAQASLIREAFARAGIDPALATYVEAHGTGTALGDPIEAGALQAIFGSRRASGRPLMVGSVKTNVGHLEAAAGVAGLIKVVLALQHGEIPPHLHLRRLNPHVPFQDGTIVIPAQRVPWPAEAGRLVAGVSSFGASGTNAHVVVEDARSPVMAASAGDRPIHLLVLSARSAEALRRLAGRFGAHLLAHPEIPLSHVCTTAATGRCHWSHRLAVVCGSQPELAELLGDFGSGRRADRIRTGMVRRTAALRVAFGFTDEAVPGLLMGRDLFQSQPVFRAALLRCDEVVHSRLGLSIVPLFDGEPGGPWPSEPKLAQPLCFVVEYALAELWRSFGVKPSLVVGQGIGEYVAACVAGVFGFEDGLRLVAERGRGNPAAFETVARSIEYRAPEAGLWSPDPEALSGKEAVPDGGYWVRREENRSRRPSEMGMLVRGSAEYLLEIGPRAQPEDEGQRDGEVVRLPALVPGRPEWKPVLESLGRLYVGGVEVDWEGFDRGYGRRRVVLPTYPFERQRCWFEEPKAGGAAEPRIARLVWNGVLAAGRECARALEEGQSLRSALARHSLESLSVSILREVLSRLGAFSGGGSRSVDEILLETGIAPGRRQLLGRWLEILAATGGLDRAQDRYTLPLHPSPETRDSLTLAARSHWVETPEVVNLLERCRELAPEVLRGRADALDLLFPGGSFGTAEVFYEKTALARYFNGIVRGIVEGVVASTPSEARLRFLEVGAGTGGTTGCLLRILPGERTDYVFSDVSPLFLRRGAERFRGHRFVDYRSLDLESPPAGQGFMRHGFDVVVAANVLHATRDLGRTLDHLKWLLAPEGILVIWELTRPSPAFEITFGLVLGEIEDAGQRGGGAFPSVRMWEGLLRSHGFAEVASFPGEGLPEEDLGQHVLLARAPAEPGGPRAFSIRGRVGSQFTVREEPVGKTGGAVHPLLERRLRSSQPIFESELSARSPGYLVDHQLEGQVVFPGAGYLEMVRAAAREVLGDGPVVEKDVVLEAVLRLNEEVPRVVQVALSGEGPERGFSVSSLDEAEGQETWRRHATGRVSVSSDRRAPDQDLEELRSRCAEEVDVQAHDAALEAQAISFGPAFRGLVKAWRGAGEALGVVESVPVPAGEDVAYGWHPARLDACLQVAGLTLGSEPEGILLPVAIDEVRIRGSAQGRLWCHARRRHESGTDGGSGAADLRVFDDRGGLLLEVTGLYLKRVVPGFLSSGTQGRIEDWMYELQWRPSTAGGEERKAGEGRWLIIADEGGVGIDLARRLETQGGICELVFAGERYERPEDGGPARIDRQSLGDWRRLIEEAYVADAVRCAGVVHLLSLDASLGEEAPSPELMSLQQRLCGSVLKLLSALTRSGLESPPQLWLVTRGAQAVEAGEAMPSVGASTLWGLGRVIAMEHPEFRCVRMDLDPSEAVEVAAGRILTELSSWDAEDQVAYRGGGRRVARLARSGLRTKPDPGSQGLVIGRRGELDTLRFEPIERRRPGPGEVELEVLASGLNFKDVLNALGEYPGDGGALGSECVGRVLSVGPGVAGVLAGDEVMALAEGCFRTHVTVAASQLLGKPPGMGAEEAATLPVAYLTASYALEEVGRLRRGERVLIHAAAGGVGQAAMKIAHRVGAEVFATAGSPAKRKFLHSQGVRTVGDSRSASFAAEILAVTAGLGVDVVLNSLGGGTIAASFEALSKGGRFLEIGKRGIWTPEQVKARRPDVSYHVIDLGLVGRKEPGVLRARWSAVLASLHRGELGALPHRVFGMSEARSAFRLLQRGENLGKIVLRPEAPAQGLLIRQDGTYLIAGGLGGLGREVARWLVEKGARHLVLLGRSAGADRAAELVAELSGAGAEVRLRSCDVSRREDVRSVVNEIRSSGPRLVAVVQAAGVLSDGVLSQQEWSTFSAVMDPKVAGSWNLHQETRGEGLDLFVLFSSAVGLFGSAGQGSHAAACAFQDALAHHRRSLGLKATSIGWGAWSEVGAAARGGAGRRLLARGSVPLTPRDGLRVLHRVFEAAPAYVAVLPLDWRRVKDRLPVDGASRFLSELVVQSRPPSVPGEADLLLKLRTAAGSDRRRLVLAGVREQILRVLGLPLSHALDPDQPLSEMGLDSLMAVEVRNTLSRAIARPLPATLLFDHPTLRMLSDHLALILDANVEAAPASRSLSPETERTSSNRLDHLAGDDLQALLSSELEALERLLDD